MEWEKVIADHKHRGLVPPAPVPHPDDILIDIANNRVEVVGPMTEREKEDLEVARQIQLQVLEQIDDIDEQLENKRLGNKRRQELLEEKATFEGILEKLPV